MLASLKTLKPLLTILFALILYPASAQESMLCMGGHWTEDEANRMMKEFRSGWDDPESWEKRADMILSLIHISEPTRPVGISRMPSSA